MTIAKNKVMAYVLSFVMAFTVFGIFGTVDAHAAEDDAAISVIMWYGKTGNNDMPSLDNKDNELIAEETIKAFTKDEINAMDQTDYLPYCFTGKNGAIVVAAKGVLVSDILNKAGVDSSTIKELKTGQLNVANPFVPNAGQKDYLKKGVTYTGANQISTKTGVAEDTAYVDVPFIIATERYEESFSNDGTTTVEEAYEAIDKNVEPLTNYRNFMGSIGTKDFAGNRFTSGVDSIILFKTATADDIDVEFGEYDPKYDGKAKTPEIKTVKLGDTVLTKDVDYTIGEYKNNVKPGQGSVEIKGINFEGTKTATFGINKIAQTMTVKASKKTLKVKKLKKKKQTVKAITVKNAKGKVTYKKVSGSKKLTVNSKTGKITVKKKTKKGTYKVKVKVTAAGDATYTPATKTVTVTVKVKK